MNRISYQNLINYSKNVLHCVGLDDFSLNAVANSLCETSLRGVDSHGIRLLPHYVNSAVTGRKNPNPKFVFQNNFPSLGHLNADNAFGHAAGFKAIDKCVEMATQQGVGIVSVSNSSHPGAMASMALKAARMGYLAFAFTNADSLVQSFNGKRAYFGSNPICMAAPREECDPYCLDMAPSVISWNKVRMHKSSDDPLPNGVTVDEFGLPTNEASLAKALIPIGGYKGYGLASMVEILCGVYSGMRFGRSIPSMFGAEMTEQRKLAQFYIVLRSDGVVPKEVFIKAMQQMSDEVRAEPPFSDLPVMLPGDREILETQNRLKNGIPLDDETVIILKDMAKKYNVSFELLD